MTNTSLLIQRNKIIKTEIKTKILKKKKRIKALAGITSAYRLALCTRLTV